MSKFREKVQGVTKQTVGQMIGDHVLVQQGRQQQHEAERPTQSDDDHADRSSQDRSSEDRSSQDRSSQGITRHQNAEEQPIDKERAQTAHRSSPKKSVSREATRDPKLTNEEKMGSRNSARR